MNSEMMAKLRGLIVEAATGTCTMTAEGKACPVHGMEECAGYMEGKENLDEAFDATAALKRVRGAAKTVEMSRDAAAATEFARQIDTDLTDLFQWYDSKQQTENKEKIRSLVKANKAAEQTANLKHANTVAEVLLDIMRSSSMVGENIKPAGISDELAAKKIAAKIMGTPDLNIPKIKQYVTKYLSMVGKAPTDVTHLAALVHTELENKGVMEAKKPMPDFLDINKNGDKKEPMKDAAKDAKAGKKSTAKKGGMSAKQAQYFGKKAAVKESMSPELQALMQKYGVDESLNGAGSSKTVLPEDEASDQQALAKLIQDIRNGPAPDPKAVMARIRELIGVDDRPAPARPAAEPGTLKHYLDNPDLDGSDNPHTELLDLMKQHGVREDEVEEDMHITVDGQEAQDMIGRLMSLAGQDMPAHDDHAGHTDMCDGCGCANSECNCDSDISTGYSGPVDLSMEENIDNDFGHTAQSDMGDPVDPDTYMYKAPVGNQRMVKGIMGDNPLLKEDADALGAKLKKDYRRYVAEAELARSNAGDASPLTADNRDKFEMDPFVNDEAVTDGSRSPLSTIKRQTVNK